MEGEKDALPTEIWRRKNKYIGNELSHYLNKRSWGKTRRTTFTVVKEILERFPMESHKNCKYKNQKIESIDK